MHNAWHIAKHVVNTSYDNDDDDDSGSDGTTIVTLGVTPGL